MKAVTWHGKRDVRVENVADPRIEEPTDAIIRVTRSNICGSDLHLYEVLGAFMQPGDILGHEPMGIVEEVGAEAAEHVQPGDRVVIPFNISCGHCWMCRHGLQSQCETTQNTTQGKGASLFGYTKLYGHVAGGQAEYLRVPQAQYGPIKVPKDFPEERFLYLSDILPTAWQAVVYAGVERGSTVAVYGLGPVGQFCARIARLFGAEHVYGIDMVPERLAMARRYGVETVNTNEIDDVVSYLRDRTSGRGPDAAIDAVGMEAHGNVVQWAMQQTATMLPASLAEPAAQNFSVDRLGALTSAIYAVRRGGTVSLSGVYGGAVDPLPMIDIFDRQLTIRAGQCNVKRWVDDIMPHLTGDSDPLGTEDLATHHMGLDQAPHGYEIFQKKQDDCVKVVLEPTA